jgi:hypothetical protein
MTGCVDELKQMIVAHELALKETVEHVDTPSRARNELIFQCSPAMARAHSPAGRCTRLSGRRSTSQRRRFWWAYAGRPGGRRSTSVGSQRGCP